MLFGVILIALGAQICESTYRALHNKAQLSKLRTKIANGNPDGAFGMAMAYKKGELVSASNTKAFVYFREAAQLGHTLAQYQAGRLRYFGIGTVQHYGRAKYWLTKAARAGHTPAQYLLGRLYFESRGKERSISTAYIWLNIATAKARDRVAFSKYWMLREEIFRKLPRNKLAEVQDQARKIQKEISTSRNSE